MGTASDGELDAKSQELRRKVDAIRATEQRKPLTERSSGEFHHLADVVEQRAREGFEISAGEEEMGAEGSPISAERPRVRPRRLDTPVGEPGGRAVAWKVGVSLLLPQSRARSCRSAAGPRGRGTMVRDLVLVISEDGQYVDANDEALATLGYTLEELRELPPGVLSSGDVATTQEVWRRFAAREIDVPGDRAGQLTTKDGHVLLVTFVGLEPGPTPGTYVSRMQIPPQELGPRRPRALHFVLQEWRAAERQLAELERDDPQRAALEREVEELRDLYQRESGRPSRS